MIELTLTEAAADPAVARAVAKLRVNPASLFGERSHVGKAWLGDRAMVVRAAACRDKALVRELLALPVAKGRTHTEEDVARFVAGAPEPARNYVVRLASLRPRPGSPHFPLAEFRQEFTGYLARCDARRVWLVAALTGGWDVATWSVDRVDFWRKGQVVALLAGVRAGADPGPEELVVGDRLPPPPPPEARLELPPPAPGGDRDARAEVRSLVAWLGGVGGPEGPWSAPTRAGIARIRRESSGPRGTVLVIEFDDRDRAYGLRASWSRHLDEDARIVERLRAFLGPLALLPEERPPAWALERRAVPVDDARWRVAWRGGLWRLVDAGDIADVRAARGGFRVRDRAETLASSMSISASMRADVRRKK